MASQAKAMAKGACDNCHRVKEKCVYDEGQASCARCTRLTKPCHQRQRKRMGRRPAAKTFSYGAYDVMSIDDQDLSPSQTTSSINSQPIHRDDSTAPSGEPQKQGSSSSISPGKKAEKEGVDQRGEEEGELKSPSPFPLLERGFSAEATRLLETPENHRVKAMLDSEAGFFAAHRSFMIGTSFLPEYYALVKHLVNHSPRILTDAYRAVLDLIALGKSPQHREGEPDIALGANCLRSLQSASASIASNEDAGVVLCLGQVLLIYNMLLPWPDARLITRYTVLGVEDWMPSLEKRPEFDNIALAPVMLDTIESLVRREIPAVKFTITRNRAVTERFIGLCASLIPLIYELCEVSHRVKIETDDGEKSYPSIRSNQQQQQQQPQEEHEEWRAKVQAEQQQKSQASSSSSSSSSSSPSQAEPRTKPTDDDDHDDDAYTPIERKVQAWEPRKPRNFLSKYTTFEVFAMLTQKDLYRSATLLIIHRLRYPLGVNDKPAREHAERIIGSLSALRAHGYKPGEASGLGVDFVLLAAMMEMPDEGMEVLWGLTPLRPQPEHSRKLAGFVGKVMTGYRKGYRGLWFDFVEGGLDGVLA